MPAFTKKDLLKQGLKEKGQIGYGGFGKVVEYSNDDGTEIYAVKMFNIRSSIDHYYIDRELEMLKKVIGVKGCL